MAIDHFLKIDGIEGESSDLMHKDEIELDSWSWGETQYGRTTGGGGGAGKVNIHDISFVARLDKHAPAMMLACATGQHIKKAVLTCRKVGAGATNPPEEFLKLCFTDVLISGYKPQGPGETIYTGQGGVVERLTENVTLNFAKIEIVYTQYADGQPVGTYTANWDVKAAKSY